MSPWLYDAELEVRAYGTRGSTVGPPFNVSFAHGIDITFVNASDKSRNQARQGWPSGPCTKKIPCRGFLFFLKVQTHISFSPKMDVLSSRLPLGNRPPAPLDRPKEDSPKLSAVGLRARGRSQAPRRTCYPCLWEVSGGWCWGRRVAAEPWLIIVLHLFIDIYYCIRLLHVSYFVWGGF